MTLAYSYRLSSLEAQFTTVRFWKFGKPIKLDVKIKHPPSARKI